MTKQRINLQARLNRHLRILKNVGFESKTFNGDKKIGYRITISLFFIIFIFPIYPSISGFVYTKKDSLEVNFDRGDIDESSIISSYEGDFIEHTDSFISVHTILDDSRDLTGVNEIVNYEVRPNDSIASIASKFGVSRNTILWANNMEYARSLFVGEIIRVPSVTGYLYKVKKGDKIEKIAKEYGITVASIEQQNGIKNGYLIAGREIILPGASKKIPVIEKPKQTNTIAKNTKTETKVKSVTKTSTSTKASGGKSEYTSSAGAYKLVARQPKWKFVWGNCTWYVAKYKNVNWGGNANQWLRNARAKGHLTGVNPEIGAIVQFSGRGYNPVYGHVGIVIDVTKTHIIVSDMNYRKLNEVTVRKVPIGDSSIDGYIYVD